MATVIVGLILIFALNDDLPDWPSTPEIWMKVIMVALFGVVQQFFIIGKKNPQFFAFMFSKVY